MHRSNCLAGKTLSYQTAAQRQLVGFVQEGKEKKLLHDCARDCGGGDSHECREGGKVQDSVSLKDGTLE